MLVLPIPEDLHELLKNRSLASITSLRKLSRVMEVTEDLSVMFVVAVLRAKDSWTHRAGEVVDVVFPIQSCNI